MLGVVACEECGRVAPVGVVRNSDHTYVHTIWRPETHLRIRTKRCQGSR
jgi:hypothetical protein